MRRAFDPQLRLDCPVVPEVRLNTDCRDEIIPILRALQHIYGRPELRDELLDAVAHDVNGTTRADQGRPGMAYWSILVLGAVRLGCDLDYDRLQNLAEEHRSLRRIMGIDGWCDDQTFDWRCLRDNICLLSPDTIERLNHLIVAEGHRLVPEAAETVRGDSFVVATDVHYPTDSSLIGDGLRTIVPTARRLAGLLGLGGWRQHRHLLRAVKKHLRAINRIAASKGRDYRKRLQDAYRALLDMADRILARATELLDPAWFPISPGPASRTIERLRTKLLDFVGMTIQACDQARRRVLAEESIPNDEKLFSLFEPQTQLIKRGKVPQPVEFGHRVLVIEDGAGFVCHYAVLPHGADGQRRRGGADAAGARPARRPDPQCVVRSRVPQPREPTPSWPSWWRSRACRSRAMSRPRVRSVRRRWRSGGRGVVIRGSSRRSARCSRATAWSGAGTAPSGATAATWGWGCWVAIFTCWASC